MTLVDGLSSTVEAMASQPWVLLVVIACCFLDSFVPVVPSDAVVITVGSLAASGAGVPWWTVVPAAALGAFGGDLTVYAVARRVPIHRMAVFRSRPGRPALAWAERQLERHAGLLIMTGRYIPVGRIAVNAAAGATGVPAPTFLRLDSLAVTAWAAYSVAIGATAGQLLDDPLVAVVVGVACGVVLGLGADQIVRRVTDHRTDSEPP